MITTEGKYILKNKKPVLEPDLLKWAKWFQGDKRIVKKTKIDTVRISTVFLGTDHGYDGAVELFETMIFGGELDQFQWRYGTWEEAERGHEEAIKKIEAK